MKIAYYVREVPAIERAFSTYSTDSNKAARMHEPWLQTPPFGMHYSAFLLHNPHHIAHGRFFETHDTRALIHYVLHCKVQLISKKNAELVISQAIKCAAAHQWEIIEIPFVSGSMCSDTIDRENEDAHFMCDALWAAWKNHQNNRLELIVRLQPALTLAQAIFRSNDIACLGTWDGSGFIPER